MGAATSIDMIPPTHIHLCSSNPVLINTIHNSLMPYNFTITSTLKNRTNEEIESIIKHANMVIFIVSSETSKSFIQLSEYAVILSHFKYVVYYVENIKDTENITEKNLHDYLVRNNRIICYNSQQLREHLTREFLNPNRREIQLGNELYGKQGEDYQDYLDEKYDTRNKSYMDLTREFLNPNRREIQLGNELYGKQGEDYLDEKYDTRNKSCMDLITQTSYILEEDK